MKQTSGPAKQPAEEVVKDIRRATRRQFSAEEKIRIVLEGLRGEESIAELCRREGIASSMYYGWSKDFLEAGKKRLAGDTARAATPDDLVFRAGLPLGAVELDRHQRIGDSALRAARLSDRLHNGACHAARAPPAHLHRAYPFLVEHPGAYIRLD